MNKVKELAAKVAECEWLDFDDKKNLYALEIVYPQAQDDLVKEANKDFDSAWDVFRNGTDEEFLGLLNLVSCGMDESEFSSNEANSELMRIAKHRLSQTAISTEEFVRGLRVGFGVLFDRFWNETEPVTKARTFDQIKKEVVSA